MVKATVKTGKINYRGKTYFAGDEVSLSEKAAKTYSKIDAIELTKAAEKKVEAVLAVESAPVVEEAPAKTGKKK
jgi:hypothetical protein